jgi:hypothetical protein
VNPDVFITLALPLLVFAVPATLLIVPGARETWRSRPTPDRRPIVDTAPPPVPAFAPGSAVRDSDSLVKDWTVALVSASGALVAISAGVLTLFQTTVRVFRWPFLAVDVPVLASLVCFVMAARLGLKALGTLIYMVDKAEKHGARDEQSVTTMRNRALRAERWFIAGMVFMLVAGFGAAASLDWFFHK